MLRGIVYVRAFSIALVAAGFCTACDKAPTGPASMPPTAPPQQTTRRIEVMGPQTVPLGGTAQFRAIGLPERWLQSRRHKRGELASRVRSEYVSISTPGLASGRERGEVRVTANFDGHREWRDVMVLPAGTYRLMGTVMEADASPGPVVGALVEVTTGVGSRLTTSTDRSGTYRLYRVSGEDRFTSDQGRLSTNRRDRPRHGAIGFAQHRVAACRATRRRVGDLHADDYGGERVWRGPWRRAPA